MIKEVFESLSERMKSDFDKTTKLVSHPVVKGSARENALMKYLRPHIPDKYEFSEGIVIDSFDHQSKQIDIIIHDRNTTPFLQDRDLVNIIPIESVYAIIEVKSMLTKEELSKCIDNVKSVRSLKQNTITGQASPTLGFVFAYDSDSSLDTVYKNFLELSKDVLPEQKITCICILNKGLVLPILKSCLSSITLLPSKETLYAMHNKNTDALLMFYLLLFQGLCSITVYPPNMMAYANSHGDFKMELNLPKDFLPGDALFPFMNQFYSIDEIRRIQELSKKELSGELKKEEFLDVTFALYIPMIIKPFGSLEKAIGHGDINYFENKISYEDLIKMYTIYQKGEAATEQESLALSTFEDMMFSIYDKNREKMKENYRMTEKKNI